MKKLLTLLLAATLVLSACRKEEKKEETKQAVESKEEVKDEAKDDSKLELNKEIDMGSYTLTVKEIKRAKANGDKDAFKIVYGLTNKSGKTINAESMVGMKAFQDGVATDFFSYSDDIDVDTMRKDIQDGAKLENVEQGIIINSFDKEVELKIVDLQGSNEVTYKIDPNDFK